MVERVPNNTADPNPETAVAAEVSQPTTAGKLNRARFDLPCFSIGLKQHQSAAAQSSLDRFRRKDDVKAPEPPK